MLRSLETGTKLRMKSMTWLLVLSFLSGTGCLLYETIWLRWFKLLFGSTAYAASATLSAFFVGLALGAVLFGGLAGRTRRPLFLYGVIELAAGTAALLVPLVVIIYQPIYASVYGSLVEDRTALIWAKVGLALLGIVPPATLLGGTLPALAAAYVGDARGLGGRGNGLYGVNTLGAAWGAAIGTLWLPEWIGLSGTYAVAIGISICIGIASLLLSRRPTLAAASTPSAPASEEVARWATTRAPRSLLVIAFASGAGTLAFEVLLIHALALVIDSTIYSFGAVLLAVLLSLGASALIVAAVPARVSTAGLLAIVLGLEALLLMLLPALMVALTGGLAPQLQTGMRDGLLLAGVFGAPALLVGGLVFPLTFRLAGEGSAGARLGGLLGANTLGGIVGSLAASFVLLDALGLWVSFALLALGYAMACVVVEGSAWQRVVRLAVVSCLLLFVLGGRLSPALQSVVRIGQGERLIDLVEGAHGVVSVTELDRGEVGRDRYLRVDGHYILAGSMAQRHQRRLGHIPLLLHGDPGKVVFVGSATGETASSALSHPIERIELVELVPAVQALAAAHFGEANRGVYEDDRVRRVIEDGRNHLRASPERYDVIVADLFVPARSGTGSMYSLDHFQAAADHLEPGGLFAQWLPLYQLDAPSFDMVVRTFLQVFPDALLWRGDFYAKQPALALIGINGAFPDPERIQRAIARLRAAEPGVEDPWVTDIRGLWMLHLGRADALELGEGGLNTDGHPRFEYLAGRAGRREQGHFLKLDWPERARRLTEAFPRSDVPHAAIAAPWVEAGDALARANHMLLTDRANAAQAARLIHEYLPEEYRGLRDNTVVEHWPRSLGRSTPP